MRHHSAAEFELSDCISCNLGCRFEEENPNYCANHEMTWDGQVIRHFCLQHGVYHCYIHYRQCRKKYGLDVFVAHPQTPYQIKKRSQQIIHEQSDQILKLEREIDNMKTSRFVCAECRLPSNCVCDVARWKYYS